MIYQNMAALTTIKPLFRQALDGDFSEENRNRCRVATAPLIEAVENLTAFASNPEFASVPAQISSEVRLCPVLVSVSGWIFTTAENDPLLLFRAPPPRSPSSSQRAPCWTAPPTCSRPPARWSSIPKTRPPGLSSLVTPAPCRTPSRVSSLPSGWWAHVKTLY